MGKGAPSLVLYAKRDAQDQLAQSSLFASKPVIEQHENMGCIQLACPQAQLANFTPMPRGILGMASETL